MRWTLRGKILTYLILLHLVLAAMAVMVLIERPTLLIAFEALFVASAVIGYYLVRAFFVPLDLIRTGTELMRERDFTTRFREVGQIEMDALIGVYNRMVDQLREERLKLEERNLFIDKVVRASPTAVVVLDLDGRIAEVNPGAERLLGATAPELAGRAPGELAARLGALLAGLGPGEATVVPAGGHRLRCRRAEFFDRGALRTFFLIDELTHELRAIERAAYGKVIRMMSHEVNNSVGAVRSLLESCESYGGRLDPPERRDFDHALDVAKTRLLHLNTFMNGLASVVRVPPPERQPCDLVALLKDLELLLGPELERLRIRVRWKTDDPLDDVLADKNQLEQVLVNVLRNAVQAIGNNGEIVVASGRDHGRRWLAIRDSGPGIGEELREGLFTPFFSTKRDGQGVGLTLAQEILSQHGFGFTLDNHPAGGAEFLIRFE